MLPNVFTPLVVISILARGISAQVPSSLALGCWVVSFAAWEPPVATGDGGLYPLPDTIHLTARKAERTYFEATRRPNRVPDILRENLDSLRAFWKPTTTDSIELWLPSWWSTGIRATLQLRSDTLRGVAAIYVDVIGRPVPKSRMTATRVSCGRGA